MSYDKIKEAQYNNLRNCVNKNLVEPILGDNYYNMAMDVYNCDKEITLDLNRKFIKQRYNLIAFKALLIISIIGNIIFVLTKFFQ